MITVKSNKHYTAGLLVLVLHIAYNKRPWPPPEGHQCLLFTVHDPFEGGRKHQNFFACCVERLIVPAPPNYLNHNMSGSIERHSVQYFEKRP